MYVPQLLSGYLETVVAVALHGMPKQAVLASLPGQCRGLGFWWEQKRFGEGAGWKIMAKEGEERQR